MSDVSEYDVMANEVRVLSAKVRELTKRNTDLQDVVARLPMLETLAERHVREFRQKNMEINAELGALIREQLTEIDWDIKVTSHSPWRSGRGGHIDDWLPDEEPEVEFDLALPKDFDAAAWIISLAQEEISEFLTEQAFKQAEEVEA